jgi:hypothetical protein
MDPARIVAESLTSRPGIREQHRSRARMCVRLPARQMIPPKLTNLLRRENGQFDRCAGIRISDPNRMAIVQSGFGKKDLLAAA